MTKPHYKFVASTRHWNVETFREWSADKSAVAVERDGVRMQVFEHVSPTFGLPCITVLSPTCLVLLRVVK